MAFKIGTWIILYIILNGLAFADTATTVKQVVKLEPRIRVESNVNNKIMIPIEEIRPFLATSLILDNKQQFIRAPYVVAESQGHMSGGAGTMIYVKGIEEIEEPQYALYREGKTYIHPVTKEVLGFEALLVGNAELKRFGDPAEFEIKDITEGVEVGTRLLPNFTSELPATLTLRPAKEITNDGYILSVRNGIDQIGPNQVVVISLGQRDGIEEGNILDIYQTGRLVVDPYAKGWRKKKIQLPDNRIGKLLVFQIYDKLSLALVLETKEIIHLLDKVRSP